MKQNLKKYLTELIGTFFLVLTVACTSLLGAKGVIAPLAIASALMIMVYAGGHISGGHYNPAVSFAAAIRGALGWKQLVPYIIAQLLGGILAVTVFTLMAEGSIIVIEPGNFGLKGLMIAECLFTFALCYVVLQTATTKNTEGNSYYGLAIGFTVLTGAFAVGGSLCAGAFNPAVAVSACLLGIIPYQLSLSTICANLGGAILAAVAFKLTYTDDKE